MLLLHLHSTMSMSISQSESQLDSYISDKPQVLPLFWRSIGGTGWDPHQCMTFTSGSSTLLQLQGILTQNYLLPPLLTCISVTSWVSGRGSASDGGVYHDAQAHDFEHPKGKYYLSEQAIPSVILCWCILGCLLSVRLKFIPNMSPVLQNFSHRLVCSHWGHLLVT